ncbi:MAG: hypothetical protein IPH03_08720 [Tetrasphaera sp.]|nr:hypothetical protein [Tetrasphaera sp.]
MIATGCEVQFASMMAARRVHTFAAVLHWPFLPESGASAVEFTVKVTPAAAWAATPPVARLSPAAATGIDPIVRTRRKRDGFG